MVVEKSIFIYSSSEENTNIQTGKTSFGDTLCLVSLISLYSVFLFCSISLHRTLNSTQSVFFSFTLVFLSSNLKDFIFAVAIRVTILVLLFSDECVQKSNSAFLKCLLMLCDPFEIDKAFIFENIQPFCSTFCVKFW